MYFELVYKTTYRVAHLLAKLGWVDFDLGSSPPPPAGGRYCRYLLPNKHCGGTSQMKVNSTQVHHEMSHPVLACKKYI